MVVRYLPYLLLTVCNSKPQSHSGSGEMGSGTEQQQQWTAGKKVLSGFSESETFTVGQLRLSTSCLGLPLSLGRET